MQKEIYDSIYQIEDCHWWYRAKRKIVLDLIKKYNPRPRGGDICDLGCGCGLMLNELKKIGNVTGVDASDDALDYCRRKFDGKLLKEDLADMKTVNAFDNVVLLDVLEHMEDDVIVLQNIYASMRDGGCLYMTVPADMRLWSQHDVNCMHYRRYDFDGLKAKLEAAGFHVLLLSYYNTRLYPVVYLIRKIEKFLRLKHPEKKLEHGFKRGIMNELLYKIFVGEEKTLLAGKAYPYGVSLIAVVKK